MNRRLFLLLSSIPVVPAIVPALPIQAQDEEQELTTEQQFAETLGAMMVAYVTQCHLSVGIIADAYVEEAMNDEQANSLLELTKVFIQEIEPRLAKLGQAEDLSGDDVEAFKETAETARLILREIAALSGFIESGEDDDRKKYAKAREKAQARFDKIFQAK